MRMSIKVPYPEIYGRLRHTPTISPATIETHQGNPEFLDDCSHGRPVNSGTLKMATCCAKGTFGVGEKLGAMIRD